MAVRREVLKLTVGVVGIQWSPTQLGKGDPASFADWANVKPRLRHAMRARSPVQTAGHVWYPWAIDMRREGGCVAHARKRSAASRFSCLRVVLALHRSAAPAYEDLWGTVHGGQHSGGMSSAGAAAHPALMTVGADGVIRIWVEVRSLSDTILHPETRSDVLECSAAWACVSDMHPQAHHWPLVGADEGSSLDPGHLTCK